jgi:hypothetical protein
MAGVWWLGASPLVLGVVAVLAARAAVGARGAQPLPASAHATAASARPPISRTRRQP